MTDAALRPDTSPEGAGIFSAAVLKPEMMHQLADALARASGIALVHAGLDGRIHNANEPFDRLNRACGGGSKVCVPGFGEAVGRVLASRQMVSESVTLVLESGPRRMQARMVPIIGDDDRVQGVAALYQDWTLEFGQLQDAAIEQMRFRDYARASSDWFWESDAGGSVTALTGRLPALLELPAENLKGQSLDTIGRLLPGPAGELPLAQARAEQKPFRKQLFCVRLPSGDDMLFHLSAVPVHNRHGLFSGWRGAAVDVTRSWRLEEDSRQTRNSLERAMSELQRKNLALDMASAQTSAALNAKNEFLAAMSHELRTPLNAIIGFAEAMEMEVFGVLGERYIGYAHDIRQAGLHLLGLINDVLDVSVIETGDVPMQRQPLLLADLVARARSLVALRAKGRNLNLDAVEAPADIRLLADERRTVQILVNLLNNAVKFTPEGGQIGVEVAPDQAGMIAVTIRDTGPGIAAADHERVFEKFQQLVDETWRGKPEGTGLGLHISRELARLMGGDLTLESALGQGARFTLTLPAA
jgi:signal transduction histidine kinase